jgi:hypothetical protein
LAGNNFQLSKEGMEELTKYEEASNVFLQRKRALQAAVVPMIVQDPNFVHSTTPKVHPHKARVKRSSHFMQSLFDSNIRVTAEHEDIYQKLMLSNKKPEAIHIKNQEVSVCSIYMCPIYPVFTLGSW